MIEEVLHPSNLMRACRQTVRNQGAAGVDGMKVDELYDYFRLNRKEIEASLRECRYLPQAIKGIEIPKEGGKTRLLGIPTVLDRMLQQAVGQVLCNHYDVEFYDYSYGFRPNRNANQAVLRALEYINSGLNWIVDIDLKSFFDEVDHCILLEILYRKIKCVATMRLIRKWLRAPILQNGRLVKRRKGMPQGSPLSPILSNILLNELDKKLESMGVKYIRYADDFSIYCSEEAEARRIGNEVYPFLKEKLHLPINGDKSGIRRPEDFNTLGHGFAPYRDGERQGQYFLVPSVKSVKSLKKRLKEITRKTTPYTFDIRVLKLKEVQRGWLHYFKMCRMSFTIDRLDKWIRSRLRYCIWHNWKTAKRRRKSLLRLGVSAENARKWCSPRMGGWATARSPILTTTITNARLEQRGYEAMLPLYKLIAPHLNEPLYTRPVRTVV